MNNSRKKLESFYLGKNEDNLIVSFWKHHPIADQNSDDFLESTLSFQKNFDCDIVKLTPGGTWQVVDYGLKEAWAFDKLGRRTVTERLIKEVDDWNKIVHFAELPDFIEKILFTADKTQKHFNNTTPVIQTIFSPISQAVLLAGFETLKEHLRTSPEIVLKALKVLSDNTIKTIFRLKKIGIDGIYYSAQHMSSDFFSEEEYKSFALDFDLKCIEECKSFSFNIIHVHGDNIYFHLEQLKSNWAIHYEFSDINPKPEIVAKSFKNPILIGISSSLIKSSDSSEDINKIIDYFSNLLNTKNIFITSGCVLPLDTPDDKTSLWIKTVRDRILQ